jgi:trehalose 6-phosphate phosphatase
MAQFLRDIEPLSAVLQHRPLGIFSDIDGTLAPIVARPEEARVSPRCRDLLQELVGAGAKVGLITGRALPVAREMTGVEGVAFAANHGLELYVDGRLHPQVDLQPYVDATRAVLDQMRGLAIQGLVIEDKGPIVAFHYRNSLNEWAARASILDAIGASDIAQKLVVQEGRKVIELRPPLDLNKGTALAELSRVLGVESIVCLGDDRTDLDMFRAARRLRDEGTPAAAIAVQSSEVSPDLLETADYFVKGVDGVQWLLGELLTALH